MLKERERALNKILNETQKLRGSEKHVHSKEGSTGDFYECPCASTSV